jgi:hypothetical protein
MNTRIDKSKVMKRAWMIKKGQFTNNWKFSECLRRAWEVEKAYFNEQKTIEQRDRTIIPNIWHSPLSPFAEKWLTNYYNRGSGAYCGD